MCEYVIRRSIILKYISYVAALGTRTILQPVIDYWRVGSLDKIHLPPTWTDMAVLPKPASGVGLDAGHEEV